MIATDRESIPNDFLRILRNKVVRKSIRLTKTFFLVVFDAPRRDRAAPRNLCSNRRVRFSIRTLSSPSFETKDFVRRKLAEIADRTKSFRLKTKTNLFCHRHLLPFKILFSFRRLYVHYCFVRCSLDHRRYSTFLLHPEKRNDIFS